jgi:acetoin utilization transport system permease protein
MASYFPKALMYREWREGRWVYLAAAILTLLPGLSSLFGYLTIPQVSDTLTPVMHAQMVDIYWHNFHRDTEQMAIRSFGSTFYILAWLLVPALRIVPERRKGELDALLVGPVDRVAWLRVKFCYGFAALLAGALLEWLILWSLHFQAPAGILTTTGELFRQVSIHWVVYFTLYTIGVFTSLCATNLAGAPLIGLGVSMFPYWASLMLGEIFPGSLVQHIDYGQIGTPMMTTLQAPAGTWAYYIQWFSPLTMNIDQTVGFTWRNPFLYWYLVLTVIVYFGATAYFRRLPAERFRNRLTYPSLWYWLLTGVSLIIASFVGDMVANALEVHGGPITQADMNYRGRVFGTTLIVATIVVWLVGYFIMQARTSTRRRHASTRKKREASQ